jgi:hypothetical protein
VHYAHEQLPRLAACLAGRQAADAIDLMVISDRLGYQDLFEAVQVAERVLARPVNPNVMSFSEWRTKRAKKDSFAARISAQPRLFVIGSDDDLV